jgi:hypothetical protein
MNPRWMFRPNLLDCILEERIAPAIANFGVIILTTSGLSLLIPFPGANSSGSVSGAGGQGTATAAQPVSGVAQPTSYYITGLNGISSLRPGNITGVPSLAGGLTASSGVGLTIQVGSGADTSDGAPTSNGGAPSANVSLATVADPTLRPLTTPIGSVSTGSSSPVLPAGQSYRDNAPVPPPTPYGVIPPPQAPSNTGMGGDPFAPNPMSGAPTLGPASSMRSAGGVMPGTVAPMPPGIN